MVRESKIGLGWIERHSRSLEGEGGRLVDEGEHIQAGDGGGREHGVAVEVRKVRRDGDHAVLWAFEKKKNIGSRQMGQGKSQGARR